LKGLTPALEREPLVGRLGHAGIVELLVAYGILLWGRENREYKREHAVDVMTSLGRESWGVIEPFRAVNPQVRHGGKVAFLSDPFDGWDMLFVAESWFCDRTLDIQVARHGPLTADELARMDAGLHLRRWKIDRAQVIARHDEQMRLHRLH
jgi:hypothetical protein